MKTKQYKSFLRIQFNEHSPEFKARYVETIVDDSGDLVDQVELKRKPRAARFAEVSECGCGGDGVPHMGFCTRARRIYHHPLEQTAD